MKRLWITKSMDLCIMIRHKNRKRKRANKRSDYKMDDGLREAGRENLLVLNEKIEDFR